MAAAGSGEGGRRGLGRQTAPRGRSGRLERRGPQPSGNWGRAARKTRMQCDTQKVLDNGDTRAGGVKGITMVACRQWR